MDPDDLSGYVRAPGIEPASAFARNLRRKLGEDAANPIWIFNERGVGYRMAKPGGL